MSENYLVISDLQIPFEAEHSLKFCKYLKKHYNVKDENVLNVGDELDSYHGGRWPKDPNGRFSPTGELAASREKLKEWYSAFPQMKLAISNHGLRWVKKATAAEIPSDILRSYRDIIEAPEGWQWKDEWRFNIKYPFRMIHGMGYSGLNGVRNAAIDAGMSTIIGHLSAHAAIFYIRTLGGLKIWAANSGGLFNPSDYAFEYGTYSRNQPCLGANVILNSGKIPIWIPYD